jgi:hypothetical protein
MLYAIISRLKEVDNMENRYSYIFGEFCFTSVLNPESKQKIRKAKAATDGVKCQKCFGLKLNSGSSKERTKR